MTLHSRPTAPAALVIWTPPLPAGVWNDRPYPAFPGFSDVDTQTIFDTVKYAFRWWDIDVTNDIATPKPKGVIAFSTLFGGYQPSGGQANPGSYNSPGIGAFVFADQLNNSAWAIGREAVHEAGHVMASLQHVWDSVTGYVPNYWMGNCLVGDAPHWTQDHRHILDAAFGMNADLNFDGRVDMGDALALGQDDFDADEAINLGRKFGK